MLKEKKIGQAFLVLIFIFTAAFPGQPSLA
jgi:hypothetical protein